MRSAWLRGAIFAGFFWLLRGRHVLSYNLFLWVVVIVLAGSSGWLAQAPPFYRGTVFDSVRYAVMLILLCKVILVYDRSRREIIMSFSFFIMAE